VEKIMVSKDNDHIIVHDLKPGRERLLAEVLSGLKKSQKELPSKYFYDERGSALFEQICSLDEYYIPGAEKSIMLAHVDEMADLIGPDALIIEYGSGECKKARFLLEHLHDPAAFIPIDISREQLVQVTKELDADYPGLEVLPVCADYTGAFELPHTSRTANRIVVFFPGSTISNFDPLPAKLFLEHLRDIVGPHGALLIGVDLKKDVSVLHRAYNDQRGLTAAFNLNILERLNRELSCDFQVDCFQHYAFYNPGESRIEMHLISLCQQVVRVNNTGIQFAKGESIWTESSYKYTVEEFQQMATASGFHVEHAWIDDRNWFSVNYAVGTN
jgi:dimethylhistidine N-methyltransferase